MNTLDLLQETRSGHDSMNRSKIEFIAYINIYYNYIRYKNMYNLGKTLCISYVIVLTVLLEC